MDHQDAKNFLLKLNHDMTTPPAGTNTTSVMLGAYGVLRKALEASLAREEILMRSVAKVGAAEVRSKIAEREEERSLPRATIPTTGKKGYGRSTI